MNSPTPNPEAEVVRCISYECDNIVPDEGDTCHECKAYQAEIAADCARSYYDRPANREDVEASIDAYTDNPAKRARMVEILEEL